MACVVEALGLAVPGSATPPAVTADRLRAAELSGLCAVGLARERVTPDRILTPDAFRNALRVHLAIGGSTNGIVHLTAMAGASASRSTSRPSTGWAGRRRCWIDLKPSGQHYMEDFPRAGACRRCCAS